MNPTLAMILGSAFLVWLVGADLTVTNIERDPLLSAHWYRRPRAARIALALIAWPLLSGLAALMLLLDRRHG